FAERAKSPAQPAGLRSGGAGNPPPGHGGAAVSGSPAGGRLSDRGRTAGPLETRCSLGAQKGRSKGGAREAARGDEAAGADASRGLAGEGEDSEVGGNLVGIGPCRDDRRHGQA